MKRFKKIFPIILLVLVLGVGVISYMAVQASSNTETIHEGVYIGNISVGGLTKEEAAQKIQDYTDSVINTEFTLMAGKKSIQVKGNDMGLFLANEEVCEEAFNVGRNGNLITRYKDIKDLEHEDKVLDFAFGIDEKKVRGLIKKRAGNLNVKAVNNGLVRENDAFTFIPGKEGCKVKVEESAADIQKYFAQEWDGASRELELTCTTTSPKGTKEELEKVRDLLGSYSTDYSTSAQGRVKNVETGASKINGSVLYPGEVFSMYEAVNPFTAENGYELAGSYENGTTVQSYGGGICQVSTTLYNAILLAELGVEERFNHSMIVSYVQPSMDAAIAGTYKDLKFSNNTKAPIYVEGYTSGGRIYFNIYGQESRNPDSRKITYESETTGTTEPKTEFKAVDQAIGYFRQVQSSHTGYEAKLWKIVTVDGVQESKEVINSSHYKASPDIFEVGVSSKDPKAVAAMKKAIQSGNRTVIAEAIAEWNADAIAKREEQEKKEEEEKKKEEQDKKDKEDKDKEDKDKEDKDEEDKDADKDSNKDEGGRNNAGKH